MRPMFLLAVLAIGAIFLDGNAPAHADQYLCQGIVPYLKESEAPLPGCSLYKRTTSSPGAAPEQLDPAMQSLVDRTCREYGEWLDLNTRTRGGVVNQGPADRQRFVELQRQFGLTTEPPAGCR